MSYETGTGTGRGPRVTEEGVRPVTSANVTIAWRMCPEDEGWGEPLKMDGRRREQAQKARQRLTTAKGR